MECKGDTSTMSFLAGLLLGGLVGAGVGLLIAPDSGEKTLAKLRREGTKVVKKSMDALEDFEKEQVEPVVDRVAKQIKTKVADVKADVKAAL
jgi:gas vesicle protein